ncbi:hypothetical protein QYZ40_26805, partial [Vibrio parahaemolyticus]|nr:hypothetical protein [Vibrio parahaemolyticus]
FAPRQTVRRYRARRDDDMIRTLERPTKRPRSIIAAEKMLFNHTLSQSGGGWALFISRNNSTCRLLSMVK